MAKEKIEVGDIRPIYNIAGFEVCKITSGEEGEEAQWTPVEKINEAEILSFIYRRDYRREKPTENKANKKKPNRPKKEIEKEIKETKEKIKEIKESAEIDDDDL